MIGLSLNTAHEKPCRILCLGAHSDDIEIGCGGTILRLLATYPNVSVNWEVLSAEGVRRKEAQVSARRFLARAKKPAVNINRFRGSYFPTDADRIKDYIETLKKRPDPDIIFTHYRGDLHQDHRVVSDLTWNTFRNHLILEYEIPKFDGDLGVPNVYVPLDAHYCHLKSRYLMGAFKSQRSKHWFTPDTFLALHRLRGIECGPETTYAEAFYGRKLVLTGTDRSRERGAGGR